MMVKEKNSGIANKKSSDSEDGASREEAETFEFEEDYSPKRGLTFIFASAGFSLFLLAVLSGLRPYIISRIAGVDYSQVTLCGYYHNFDLVYAVVTTIASGTVAALIYFSWSGEKKWLPDCPLIGLSVSIFSLFLQNEAIRIGYTFDWAGILALLALGTLSGFLGLTILNRRSKG
ncbi:MAG: hypothetical protein QXG44_00015 [Candidatus Jordarchaeaceae archaeon]